MSKQFSDDPRSLFPSACSVLDENGAAPNPDINTLPPELIIELLRQRIRELALAKNRIANDVADLRQENRRLLSSVSQIQGENLALNRALRPAHHASRQLEMMSVALERLSIRLEEDNVNWRREMARRADDVAAAERRTAAAEVSAAQARQRVEALESSTSWRLTKPVRVLGRLMKGRS